MTDKSRGQAGQGRDDAADGRLVYAVKSTAIYCWPTCASRGPLRRNVRFLDLLEAAEQEGYRPCKCCRPVDGRSPHHLQSTFKKLMGATPAEFGDPSCLNRLKVNLKQGEILTNAMYDVGYGVASRFY